MAYTKEEQFLRIFKGSIKIDARTISVKTLLSDRNLKRINYSPYYQRNYVWDNVKQSFFIESVILGTEIPPLIFFKSGLKIEVIDGRQRFETLKKFKENDVTLNSKGLMSLVNLAKQSFIKLNPQKLQDVFWESNIRVFEFEVINEPDLDPYIEDKIKKEIFRRYNTGITPLTSSEVDNAKYDKDILSEMFKKELSGNPVFKTQVKECFYSSDSTVDDVEDMANYLRRLFILNRFPISRYATGKDRTETLDLLYDFSTQSISNYDEEFDQLKNQITRIHEIFKIFTAKDSKLKNKLIYECLFWAFRILEEEEISPPTLSLCSNLSEHYLKNLIKYGVEGSHYYSNIIGRFQDTADAVTSIIPFDFSNYIRNSNFKHELKTQVQKERDSVEQVDQFDHLRIHKPAPISTPIDEIKSDIKTSRYLVRPSYQRQEKISVIKASSIIESILLGINLPPVFVFKRTDKVKEVIDGQQRLLSTIGFLGEQYLDEKGKLVFSKNDSFKLKGLKILSELNGMNYSALSDENKTKILDFTIDFIIIEESINKDFDPTDLFIRLNNKPYPIQQNSFEMWNSTVDAEVIQKIKEVTKEHASWFYSKETKTVEQDRNDRMENEELITILSYIKYNSIFQDYDKIIAFFTRQDRITCRLKYKEGLTDFLTKLEKTAVEKDLFLECIQNTDKLIKKLKALLGGNPNKDSLNSIFNVRNINAFRRSFQDFYIMWIMLVSINDDEIDTINPIILTEITDQLKHLKNTENLLVDDKYLQDFHNTLKGYYNN